MEAVTFSIGARVDHLKHIAEYEYDEASKLGEGGYGTVYKGRHTATGREVAVKILQTERVKDDELEAIKKAQSDCVVRFLDVIKMDNFTYMIMELCDMDLSQFLTIYGKLNEHNLITVARCLAEGYLVLHRHSIVHRDIKPQNILLKIDEDSDTGADMGMGMGTQPRISAAKFTDFGCSRVTNGADECRPSNLAGTFFYMAPEVGANVVDSFRYDEEVDMWSMGVVLHQAMTGRVPFDEQQLCRLFLRAVDNNYSTYKAPEFENDRPEAIKNSSACGQEDGIDSNSTRHKHYQDIVQKLLQLDPSARLTPTQFHAYVAHNEPSSFLKCLNEGSCSKAHDRSLPLRELTLGVRRTASAIFERLKNAVGVGKIS